METITCTGYYEIPEGFEASGGRLAPANGCRRTIDVPKGPWDVKTDDMGHVLSEHREVVCPHCGVSTFVENEL